MKTSRNSLSALMLVMMLYGASNLLAQSRGRGNGNDNHNKGGNPGRSHDMGNIPGKDHNKEYNGHGHDRDINDRRGNNRYGDRNHHDRYNNDWNHEYASRDDHRYNNYDSRHRYVTYNYHHHSHPSWAPAYGYRYNTRYLYYQDYNVYYDCHRDVFVIWTGRNWAISNRIPDVMYQVDFERTRVSGVDYWDDDFDFYLQRRRPAYLSISAGW